MRNAKCTKINCVIPALDIRRTGRSAVSHTFVKRWGSSKEVIFKRKIRSAEEVVMLLVGIKDVDNVEDVEEVVIRGSEVIVVDVTTEVCKI
jgi:hypothetical protein